MVDVSQKYQDELPGIKKNIEKAYEYFRPNIKRFHEFKKFVFQTTLTDAEISIYKSLQKAQLECNILEAYISRLRGEFSKQEPSLSVRAIDGQNVFPGVTEVVEGYTRNILFESNSNGFEYEIYTDLLGGGFSVGKAYTEYASDREFDQIIKVARVYDPTMCGFDPLSRLPHKGDSRYCYEAFPKSREELEEMGIDVSEIKFTRQSEAAFNWSYNTNTEDIAIICNYYVKKIKPVTIVKVVNSDILQEKGLRSIMTLDDYKDMLEKWDSLAQPPAILDKRRSKTQRICRYQIIESSVIEYKEMDFKFLPLVFFDGNSQFLQTGDGNGVQQMTRPYVYHAKGAQKLKNFAGICLATELENMVQHKWKVPVEAIPAEYVGAYKNPQQASVLAYNQFKDNDPLVRLDPPMEIARPPIPPEIINTFQLADSVIQGILGSYDASLGINDNQLSGVAIVEGATQSNAAAMPYVVGFLSGLNQIGQIILDVIPKYYKTPRTIPIVAKDGTRSYVSINQNGGVNLNYGENSLEIKIEAGVNFAIQKSRALQQIIALMNASPLFAQFMNQQGLPVLLDNIEIRGIDQLKGSVDEFMQQLKVQQQMQMKAQQQAMQNNPAVMKFQQENMKMQQAAQQNQANNQLRAAEIANDAEQNQIDKMKLILQAQQSQDENMVQMDKASAEKYSKAVDLALRAADMSHNHEHDKAKIANEMLKKSQNSDQQDQSIEVPDNE